MELSLLLIQAVVVSDSTIIIIGLDMNGKVWRKEPGKNWIQENMEFER